MVVLLLKLAHGKMCNQLVNISSIILLAFNFVLDLYYDFKS